MNGINASTGKRLQGRDHLRQSLRDILATPIGTRVLRRDYGSSLFRLVDAPLNRATILQLYAATALAIKRWEPRFKLEKVRIASATPGAVLLDLSGEYLPDGSSVIIDGIMVN